MIIPLFFVFQLGFIYNYSDINISFYKNKANNKLLINVLIIT